MMRENMERSYGLFFSQRVLTTLIDAGMPRQKAYEAVQKQAMESWTKRTSFPDLIMADSEISSLLGGERLRELFDANFYLHNEDQIFARVFADSAHN